MKMKEKSVEGGSLDQLEPSVPAGPVLGHLCRTVVELRLSETSVEEVHFTPRCDHVTRFVSQTGAKATLDVRLLVKIKPSVAGGQHQR